jgi:hypothetical protein
MKGREGLSDSMAFQGMFTFNPNNVALMDEYQVVLPNISRLRL